MGGMGREGNEDGIQINSRLRFRLRLRILVIRDRG
jgi:hypothetical protein